MKNRYFRISIYILKEVMFSFIIAFLFFFIIFFLNQVLVSARDHLAKGVSVFDVLQIVLYAIPTLVYLAAPFASMGAVILALGRLSVDNEILALLALGVSKHRIFLPILVLGIFLTIFSFLINDILMPLGGIQQRRLFIEIALNNIQVEFSPYSVKKVGSQTIITGNVDGRTIYTPLMINRTNDQKVQVIEAERASFQKGSDRKTLLSLELSKVHSLTPDLRSQGSFDSFTAEKMYFNVFMKDINSNMAAPSPADMSTVDVFARIKEMQINQDNREFEKYTNLARLQYDLFLNYQESLELVQGGSFEQGSVERQLIPILDNLKIEVSRVIRDYLLISYKIQFFQKFTVPLGCVELVLIGFSVGIFNKRRGRAISIIFGLGISFVYWSLLFVAQIITQQLILPAEMAMFLPNLLLLITGLWLYIVRRNN